MHIPAHGSCNTQCNLMPEGKWGEFLQCKASRGGLTFEEGFRCAWAHVMGCFGTPHSSWGIPRRAGRRDREPLGGHILEGTVVPKVGLIEQTENQCHSNYSWCWDNPGDDGNLLSGLFCSGVLRRWGREFLAFAGCLGRVIPNFGPQEDPGALALQGIKCSDLPLIYWQDLYKNSMKSGN